MDGINKSDIESTNKQQETIDAIEVDQEYAIVKPTIESVINCLLHAVLDVEDAAKEFFQTSANKYNEEAERLRTEMSSYIEILDSQDANDIKLPILKSLRRSIREIDRHNNSSPVETLQKSLFIYLFAAFDKYIGDLISVLYSKKTELYNNLNRDISLSEAIKYQTIDELKLAILDKEIETIRRKSYIEQFKDLENKFGLTLTRFDSWPNFIECSQRRNLFTHCDGVVSKQYLDVCAGVNFKFKKLPDVGERLEISTSYFFGTCRVLTEVAVMLGHTLWRKILPDDFNNADSHLNNIIFDFLHIEDWQKAISLSKFALALPKKSTDEMERIFTINYAIALKASSKPEDSASKNVLDKKDWSATTYDFKLAYAVLTENYLDAQKLMIKMGKEGELINELSYHDWPLFRDFREKEEFFDGYLQVYGYKYSSKLGHLAEEKKMEVEEVVIK